MNLSVFILLIIFFRMKPQCDIPNEYNKSLRIVFYINSHVRKHGN